MTKQITIIQTNLSTTQEQLIETYEQKLNLNVLIEYINEKKEKEDYKLDNPDSHMYIILQNNIETTKKILETNKNELKQKYLAITTISNQEFSQNENYEQIKKLTKKFHIKLLEFAPNLQQNNTLQNNNQNQKLSNKIFQDELNKQINEIYKLLQHHELENPIENN